MVLGFVEGGIASLHLEGPLVFGVCLLSLKELVKEMVE